MRRLQPGDESILEAFLLPRIETSMFLLANSRVAGLVNGNERLQGCYAACIPSDESGLSGVATHYNHGYLIIQLPVVACGDHFHKTWQLALSDSKRKVRGIIGPADQVAAILERLSPSVDEIESDSVEILYKLGSDQLKQIPIAADKGLSFRAADPDDTALLEKWLIAYAEEIVGGPLSKEEREQWPLRIKSQLADNSLWILQQGNSPVSTCGFNAKTEEAVQIGGVYTPPEFRNNGFAKTVVAAAMNHAFKSGVSTGFLFTAKTNLPAQRAYTAIGFSEIDEYRIFRFA